MLTRSHKSLANVEHQYNDQAARTNTHTHTRPIQPFPLIQYTFRMQCIIITPSDIFHRKPQIIYHQMVRAHFFVSVVKTQHTNGISWKKISLFKVFRRFIRLLSIVYLFANSRPFRRNFWNKYRVYREKWEWKTRKRTDRHSIAIALLFSNGIHFQCTYIWW